MPTNVSVIQTVKEGTATALTNTKVHVAESIHKLNEAIADAETDYELLLTVDDSALKVFTMVCDQAVTVKTNSSGTPQETFTLVAGVPVVWQEGDASIFAGDVDKIFVTNASGSAATLEIFSASNVPPT